MTAETEIWRSTETAPRDGTTFLALQWGHVPCFVRYQRPDTRFNRKRWLVIGEQGAIFTVDDLIECDQEIRDWRPLENLRGTPSKKYVREIFDRNE
jgi:hypothetical protein